MLENILAMKYPRVGEEQKEKVYGLGQRSGKQHNSNIPSRNAQQKKKHQTAPCILFYTLRRVSKVKLGWKGSLYHHASRVCRCETKDTYGSLEFSGKETQTLANISPWLLVRFTGLNKSDIHVSISAKKL